MSTYGLPAHYTARTTPAYFDDVRSDGKVWQPEVVPIAAYLARRLQAPGLIDIGCGRGQNLLPYAGEFAVLGVDYGANIDYCQQHHHAGTWMACDLEQNTPDIPTAVLRESVVICSDVIEHLVNPERLALTLAQYAICAPAVILTTPDRERTYGYDQHGPPGNPHHVREWTLDEMGKWLGEMTPHIAWAGWTLSNNKDGQRNTMMLILSRTSDNLNNIKHLFNLEAWHDI